MLYWRLLIVDSTVNPIQIPSKNKEVGTQNKFLLFPVASNGGLAAEALAALASKEDFASVALRSAAAAPVVHGTKPTMLLQVKGRRRVQVRDSSSLYQLENVQNWT